MAHEGVIRLNVPDALLSAIGHSAVLSICGDVFLWVEKKEKKLQRVEILKGNGLWGTFVV